MEYRLLIWNIKNEEIALDNSKKMLIFSSVPLPMPLRAVPVLMPMHACVQPSPYLWTKGDNSMNLCRTREKEL